MCKRCTQKRVKVAIELESEVRCRSCGALNPADNRMCEKCGAPLIPDDAIVIEEGNSMFLAEASDGFLEHQSGFFRRIEDKWIVGELTLLRGIELIKRKNGYETKPTVKPILILNKNGERTYQSLKERVVSFNGKGIVLEGTIFTKPLETLMSYETAVSFLKGRNEDLREVYPILKERIAKFVNLGWDPRLYDLATCVTISTYFFDVFRAFPIVFPYGPQETGKSRLVKCIVYGGRKGLLYVSPTPAPLFRAIDAIRPTLGVDEFTKMYEELMQLARAIYKKGLLVPRMEKSRGQRFFLSLFETYTPLVVASTKELDPVTMSRAIVINMRRAQDPSKRDPEPWDFEDIRDRLYICRLTQAHIVDDARRELDKMDLGLFGREYEVWRPVLVIAKIISEELFSEMLNLAKEISAQKYEGLYQAEKDVLTAIGGLFKPQLTLEGQNPGELTFYPKQLSDKLFELKKEEFGYEETGSEKIDAALLVAARKKFDKLYGPRKIGWILKRLGLKYKHHTEGNRYTLTWKEFSDLCGRFGVKVDM